MSKRGGHGRHKPLTKEEKAKREDHRKRTQREQKIARKQAKMVDHDPSSG